MQESRLATYLPPWSGPGGSRCPGVDEDAVTMAVEAGGSARGGDPVDRVVVVTRRPALLEGGSAAVICAGLGLPDDTAVEERLGGAAAALDAIATAAPGSLVVGVDAEGAAGAGALFVSGSNPVVLAGRVQRSLPIRTVHPDGRVFEDDDVRLVRERSTRASLEAADLPDTPQIIAGLPARDARPFVAAGAPALPTTGASSPFFGLASLAELGATGPLVALDQAALAAATLDAGLAIERREPAGQPPPSRTRHAGADIKFALTAYDRAFDSKLRWQAGECEACATLAFPPRERCLGCGAEGAWSLTPLPRTGVVYTDATIHVPVPGLETPYTLAVVELDDVDVRALVTVTDVPPGYIDIGDRGQLVFRRVAVRSGVPDYGFAFSPDVRPTGEEVAA